MMNDTKMLGSGLCVATFMCIVWGLYPSLALAFSVPPLPDDNLIENPWFRSTTKPGNAGLDGWNAILQDDIGWHLSSKESNPSPDIVVSGKCGNQQVYCGTAARWARLQGKFYPGMDVYLYQVVQADSTHRKLKIFTHWINRWVEVAEVTIYGGTPDGPWTKVLVPFFLVQDGNPPSPGNPIDWWYFTDFLETTIARGYRYYKVEIHARYPESQQSGGGGAGVKITGVYFATEPSGGQVTPTPNPSYVYHSYLPTMLNHLPAAKVIPTPSH